MWLISLMESSQVHCIMGCSMQCNMPQMLVNVVCHPDNLHPVYQHTAFLVWVVYHSDHSLRLLLWEKTDKLNACKQKRALNISLFSISASMQWIWQNFLECMGMTLSVVLQTITAHTLISRIKLCFKNHLILLDKRDLRKNAY